MTGELSTTILLICMPSSFKTFFLANHSTSYFLMRPSNRADIFGGKFACFEEEENGFAIFLTSLIADTYVAPTCI